ncbi:hypothetical protein KR222_002757, partial [Zaprionus bogoriensis]
SQSWFIPLPTNSKMSQFLKSRYAFKYLEYVMNVMGLRPGPARNKLIDELYFAWTLTVLCIVEIYLPIGFVLPFVKRFETITPEELMSSLTMFFNVPALSIKLIILMTNLKRVEQAKELLDTMYERCVTDTERLEVQAVTIRCITITKIYIFAYVTTPALTMFTSVLSGHAPYNLYNPFVDWHDGTRELWIASAIELFVLLVAVTCNLLVDSLPFIFGMTVRGHIKLLKRRVLALREDPNLGEDENFAQLVLCIKDHKLLLEYCHLFRPIISRSLFTQFTALSVIMASTLIHLFFFANFLTGLSSAWYMTACVLQSFPICFTCDLIIDDCDDLVMTIFHSNWISADRPYKLALIFFMQNVQQPIQFLGGGILPICLNTYSRLVKMSFSLITCVKQMNLVENVK